MNIAQGGVPAVLEVTFDSPTLFVAMKVYDVTGTPALVATVPMAHLVNNTYLGSFTPAVGKNYAVSKAVYTDGTYATRDDNYSTASETLQAVTSLDAALSLFHIATLSLVPTAEAEMASAEAEGEGSNTQTEAEVVEIIDLSCT